MSEGVLNRTGILLAIPCALYGVLGLLLAVTPGVSSWPESSLFCGLPYLLLGAALLLSVSFSHGRVALVSLILGVGTIVLHALFRNRPAPEHRMAAVLLLSLFAGGLTAALYHLPERNLLTRRGLARFAAVLLVVLAIGLLGTIPALNDVVSEARSPFLQPVSQRWFRLPLLSFLASVSTLPFLFIRRRNESPAMGPLLFLSCVFFLTAAHFAGLPASGRALPAFVAFSAGAGLCLVWAVLESSWRHAHLDELTQLPTRRTLEHDLASLEPDFAIAVVDIDHFKTINDTYGHGTGDQVLRFLAATLARSPAGRAYRLGGEEFVLLAEEREWNGVLRDLEALRSAIARKRFGVRGKDRPRRKPRREEARHDEAGAPALSLTVSIGAARSGNRYATPQEVLQAADRALYEAKNKGRNQVCVAR